MHGRRLATTEELIAVVSPGSEDVLDRLETIASAYDLSVSAVDVGTDIGHVYEEGTATLGLTIGGDGTFFEGIKTFAPRGVPVLGINTGTLSFLARVEPEDLEAALEEALRGRAAVDNRQQVRVETDGLEATGINEIMLEHAPPENPIDRKITRLDVFANDEYVGEFEGTGLAVSTPTGSTGISLSANGPIHYPVNNHSIQLVPLHTHQLGVRPVVMAPSTELRIYTEGPATLQVDGGRVHTAVNEDEEVLITGAETPAYVVRTSYDDHFFTAITKKLGWDVRSDEGRPLRADVPRIRPSRAQPNGTSRSGVPNVDAMTAGLDRASFPTDFAIDDALEIAIEAAHSAGEPLRELHGQVESVGFKTDKANIITEADRQADRIITTAIRAEFPDHSLFSEESGHRASGTPYTWVIDPLDGTGNFAHGNPNYAISIGLVVSGTPTLGVVYVPETDELFAAVEGGTAWQNGRQIATTDRNRLPESMLLSGYDPDGSFLANFYQETRGVRRLGAAALNLCYLARGSADAVWEFDTYPWDVAAGLVIARAAGARITDGRGKPFEFDLDVDSRKELLGSNGVLHPALQSHLDAAVVDSPK
ncbi:NAD(+)/NADH kinase [Halobacteria archaeon AArc-curdl1]|uniref:NAD kinase n=1 Tax=Natronosalvus hydrolyticus TaxID=2979988 RepID=A0AAP2ZB25_9EURY|nr:NAD(+)/NADH kinase [Halobacteria archaeon AArc-curdl1]